MHAQMCLRLRVGERRDVVVLDQQLVDLMALLGCTR